MKPEVVSAIAAAISAFSAFIAICYQIKSKRDMDKEKTEFARGLFYIVFCDKNHSVFKLGIKNRGAYCVTNFSAKWSGNYDAKVNVRDLYWGEGSSNRNDYEVILDFSKKSSQGSIKGTLTINYEDVYGNTKKAIKEIEILSKVENLEEKEYLIYDLIGDNNRLFR